MGKRKSIKRRTKRERVESLLKNYTEIFTILGLEKKLLFPKGTIHKFLKYDRKLSDNRIDTIDKLINKIIEDYEREYEEDIINKS